jgi:hypothetical protein
MDTGFYNRTGITGGWAYSGINLYPGEARLKWIKRINPFVFVRSYRDRMQGGDDRFIVAAVRMYFTRQGYFRVHLVRGQEPWAQNTFHVRATEVQGQVQMFRWLSLGSNLSFSQSIFYDPANPFLGKERYLGANLIFQPSPRLNQSLGFTRDVFDRLAGGPRVYAVNIFNSRTNYQISKRFSARAILQYDSSRSRLLTDFLGAYELVPGTVAYAGYGALLEKRSWDGQQWLPGTGNYLNTQRGLFIKVSYLYRF